MGMGTLCTGKKGPHVWAWGHYFLYVFQFKTEFIVPPMWLYKV